MKVSEVYKEQIDNSKYKIVGCMVNNEYKTLDTEIDKEKDKVKFIDLSSAEGMKVYRSTLVYIMGKAFETLYPGEKIYVEYQLSNSMFCRCKNVKIDEEFINNLKIEMKRIIDADLPISSKIMSREEAQKFFDETDSSKGRIQLDLEHNSKICLYYCEDYFNFFYSLLANRTGIIDLFDLVIYYNGFLVRYPSSHNPDVLPEFKETKKLTWALDEFQKIHSILGINTVYKLNKAIEEGKINDVILLAEALHEKKIVDIADDIVKKRNVKMVLIAGPSSSGKTTFAQRLGIQLRLNGIKPVTISVDNYFVERKDNPKDENGEYDFECIEAIDIDLFNNHLVKLLNGEEIDIPEFDFKVGTKKYKGKKMSLKNDEILVVEGIHCLNDKLTSQISKEQKYKVYISALTILNMDKYSRVSTTDTRLLRRIVRDYQFRGNSALHTLRTWKKVIHGEEKNIFPYQEEADTIFNSSLVYEISVLKDIVTQLLQDIDKNNEEYAEANRLLNIIKFFKAIPPEKVPTNSLLKEFIGGGFFNY